MDRKVAKELLHVEGWMSRIGAVIAKGKDAYLADDLLQEAGDSLTMKLGEAANRLTAGCERRTVALWSLLPPGAAAASPSPPQQSYRA